MQLLAERGDVALPRGQKIVAVLLFEDLLIVPLLGVVAFMSPVRCRPRRPVALGRSWASASASLAG